ncbi:hypothetical protein NQ318_023460 [Aromia moschata]|uniref:Homeobox domain-containing protein n=1 Tax=Aromia moschata TaxID=1265417 RepID=A0AAV8YM75_9CUCU|nr:hypothetical protein NQ318_023460 [Aromia moschata]
MSICQEITILVWFKNRRAKCRQQLQQQQNKPNNRTPPTPTKTKPSKASPVQGTPAAVAPAPNLPTPSTSVSPPVVNVKKESPQLQGYKANGSLTPLGSNTSSLMTTPLAAGQQLPLQLARRQRPQPLPHHHYYGQNYNPAYYSQSDYFQVNPGQQNAQNQVQMGNHMGGTYQMGGYPGMSMSAASHHQNFNPRHPSDCTLDYMNQMV